VAAGKLISARKHIINLHEPLSLNRSRDHAHQAQDLAAVLGVED
jgi:hypothetical protein